MRGLHEPAVVEGLSDALHSHARAAPAASNGRVADGVDRLAAAHGQLVCDAGLRGATAARAGAAAHWGRSSMRWRRIVLIVIGLVVVLPIAAIGIFIATFNVNGWKPRIQDAVMRA